MTQEYNATVVKNDMVSDGLYLLTVKPDFEIEYFRPGQFTTLGLKLEKDGQQKLIKRAYSITSSPAQHHFLEFYIVLVPDGALTPHLFDLEPGDRLYVGPKITGNFTIDKIPPDKNLLMVATGTGIAPYMSMIRTHLVCGEGGRKFIVVQGARHSYELGFYAELCVLDLHCNNFHYIPTVSRPQNDPYWGGPTGRVTKIIQEGLVEKKTKLKITPESFDILLCGNPDMIRDMTEHFEGKGFTSKKGEKRINIHTEKYW